MLSDPASPTTNVHEHALPYRVLMAEIEARRPGAIRDPDVLQRELNEADASQVELDRKRQALIQAARELSAATRKCIDTKKLVPERDRAPGQEQQSSKGGRAFRAYQAALKEHGQQDEKYNNVVAEYQAAVQQAVDKERPLKKRLHGQGLTALCFSGGGIRSASFGLGILSQFLRYSHPNSSNPAKKSLLKQVDYVSTVSGGGYIGSWFTGWIKRNPRGLDGVIDEMAGTPATSADPEPRPIRHLRDYTSYLAPRTGALSADTWTLAAIVLRNLLLNWTILVPAFAAVLLLPVLDSDALTWFTVHWVDTQRPLYAAVVFAFLALAYIAWKLPGNYKVQPRHTNFLWAGVPMAFAAWFLAVNYLTDNTSLEGRYLYRFFYLWGMAAIAHVGLIAGRVLAALVKGGHQRYAHFFRYLAYQALVSVPTSLAAAGFLWLLYVYAAPWLIVADPENLRLYVSLSVPLIWVTFMLAVVLLNGLSAPFEVEEDREWWARSGSFVMRVTLLWAVAHVLVLYSTDILNAFRAFFGATAGAVTLPAITVAVGAFASWIGFSPATPAGMAKVDTTQLGKVRDFLAGRNLLIPALGGLFFMLLAVVLAAINDAVSDTFSSFGDLPGHIDTALVELVLLAAVAVLFNLFINVNTFSLHAMYRSRLLRAYLGASNDTRKPNPFINFDPDDNFPMHEAPHSANAPLHVINMALNLVATRKLAWQQRKAESFTVTPLHSGSFRVGYQPTGDYAGRRDGITIGTAMAISGAAASPNMGYHSSPILTLAMTFFNARLGWWLPNPGQHGRFVWKRSGPIFSLGPLLNEGMGRTTDEKQWIYTSDGGHFENLALYEMVLRRCKRIIVVDASADREFKMEDLGNAVRKIRIDLGVPIEFVTAFAIHKGKDPANRHCAVAEIKYGCVDRFKGQDGQEQEAESGWLVYIKASMNGKEPADVLQYSAMHEDFPHESTANQFFNESQFESYVRLGSDIVAEIVTGKFGPNPTLPLNLEEFFEAARIHAGPLPQEPPSKSGAGS